MSSLAITHVLYCGLEQACEKVTEAIKPLGFGILTRIDFSQKMHEKLNETINPCVILGACNPRIAFDAYQQSSDTALLIPCNVVLTEIAKGQIKIEVMRPTKMLEILPDIKKTEPIAALENALESAVHLMR